MVVCRPNYWPLAALGRHALDAVARGGGPRVRRCTRVRLRALGLLGLAGLALVGLPALLGRARLALLRAMAGGSASAIWGHSDRWGRLALTRNVQTQRNIIQSTRGRFSHALAAWALSNNSQSTRGLFPHALAARAAIYYHSLVEPCAAVVGWLFAPQGPASADPAFCFEGGLHRRDPQHRGPPCPPTAEGHSHTPLAPSILICRKISDRTFDIAV